MEALLDHVAPFCLVLARIGGLFVFAPVIGSPLIPMRVRALLAVTMTLAAYAAVPGVEQAPVTLDLVTLSIGIVSETLIGVAIGLVAMMPIVSIQLGGLLMGFQLGLGIASIYDPATDSESSVLGQMLLYVALAIFVMLGGVDFLFHSVVMTFATVPLGEVAHFGPTTETIVGLLTSGFELALRVATPVLGIIALETVATALIMKTMPQMNIMSVGFPIRIMVGLFGLAAAMAAIGEVVGDEIIAGCNAFHDWALGLTPAGTGG